MGLINRVAISNVLNFYGDSPRAPWSPRFRYECLDFRGQSTAVNLTNGGGKTTLAEAVLAVLSRDQSLVSKTKKKFSPKSSGLWSHVQVELIRPVGNTGQADFITDQGNEVNGEHWVFGMYGHRNDQGMNYYYYKGQLKDVPIGEVNGYQRILVSNDVFVQRRKAQSGLMMGPHEDEWKEALTLKVNLPQSTIKQMVDFQKRGGQDKSALLHDIKPRPGQSYAEVFFYKVLAPAIMEGVMDREGEEGEVRLEDTVERAVFSTVKAKQDTEARRREAKELGEGVEQLTRLMKVADEAQTLRAEFELHLKTIQTDVAVLTELVRKGRLPGVPKGSLPEGMAGEVAPHLVVELGSPEVRVLDRGLSVLLGDEPKIVNQRADRSHIIGRETTQVIDIPCDLFLQGGDLRGNKPKSYSISDAISLIKKTASVRHGLTQESAIAFLEDAVSWFDQLGDSNPYRLQFVEQQYDLQQVKQEERDLEVKLEELQNQQNLLLFQQQRMETNEGLYNALVESGLFTDEELKAPNETAATVARTLEYARNALRDFELLEAQLTEYRTAWDTFVQNYSNKKEPGEVLKEKEADRQRLVEKKHELTSALNTTRNAHNETQKKQNDLTREQDAASQELGRLSEHRGAYREYGERFGYTSPETKENELRKALRLAEMEVARLEPLQVSCQEGVNALRCYHETISEGVSPAEWLNQVTQRRAEIAVKHAELKSHLKDLHEQREVLDQENIAANAATRKALEKLDGNGISYKSLHNAIDALELDVKRKRVVLGVFSALLFAPVLDTEHDAQRAAEVLADAGAQMPVFLSRSVSEYCRNAVIESANDDQLLVGTVSGVVTRSVACLLDPHLVIREKESLDARIIETKSQINELAGELVTICDESEPVVLAQRARRAVENNDPEELRRISVKLDQQRDVVEQLYELTSDMVLAVIRGAASYAKLGGHERDEALRVRIDELTEEVDSCSGCIAELQRRMSELEEQIVGLDSQLQDTLPLSLATMLKGADTFYQKGGPEFIANREEKYGELSRISLLAEKRAEFNRHFNGAQAYVDSVSGYREEADIQKQLTMVSRQHNDTKQRRDEARIKRDALSESMPLLRSAMESIDKAAFLAIKKYRKVALLSEHVIDNVELIVDDHRLAGLCDDLRFMIRENNGADIVKRQADAIAGDLDDIDIDRKAGDLRRSQNELSAKEGDFVAMANRAAANSDGLKSVERKTLEEVKSAKDINNVRSLHEGLLEQHNRISERLHQCESSELEARRGVTSRLAHLIEYAAMDLEILRSVVGSRRGTHASYFMVSADVLDKTGIQKLMDSVLTEVDVQEEQRRERAEKGLSAPDDDVYHDSLRALIRDRLYKSIFSNPTITYVNESIRAAGDANEFNENLSEGQKAALSLMWTIRLAEFAIEREAKRLSSRRSQKMARDMSVNIMLIDGLFSNLSNRELIDSSMAGIESTRGRFQLIGLIHNPHYQNDYEKFPVFIVGKNESNGRQKDGLKGWVSFRDENVEKGTLRTAQTRRIPAPQVL